MLLLGSSITWLISVSSKIIWAVKLEWRLWGQLCGGCRGGLWSYSSDSGDSFVMGVQKCLCFPQTVFHWEEITLMVHMVQAASPSVRGPLHIGKWLLAGLCILQSQFSLGNKSLWLSRWSELLCHLLHLVKLWHPTLMLWEKCSRVFVIWLWQLVSVKSTWLQLCASDASRLPCFPP